MPTQSDTDSSAPLDQFGGVQGKYVILGVLFLAVAAAVVSWIYYARLQRRPIELWGSRAAELMLRAPLARAYRLAPDRSSAGTSAAEAGSADRQGADADIAQPGHVVTIGGETLLASDERDVSHAPGFSHIRQSLIHDRSFAWDAEPVKGSPRWEYAIEFDDQGDTAMVVFAPRSDCAALVGSDRTVSIRPVSAAIRDFLVEQYPAKSEAKQSADTPSRPGAR